MEQALRVLGQSPHIHFRRSTGLGEQLDPGFDERSIARHLHDAEALDPLDHQPERAVGELEHLVNVGQGADPVQVAVDGLVDGGVALGHDADHGAVLDRIVDQGHGGVPRDGEGQDGLGKEDGVAKRKDGQLARNVLQVHLTARLEIRLGGVSAVVAHDALEGSSQRSSCAARAPARNSRSSCAARSMLSWQPRQRSANGSARRRAELMSSPHSSQLP